MLCLGSSEGASVWYYRQAQLQSFALMPLTYLNLHDTYALQELSTTAAPPTVLPLSGFVPKRCSTVLCTLIYICNYLLGWRVSTLKLALYSAGSHWEIGFKLLYWTRIVRLSHQ